MEIETANKSEIVDITAGVERYVQESGMENGICMVYSLHTTTALIINEADDALLNDILELMEKIVPRAPAMGMTGETAMPMPISGRHCWAAAW